MNFSTSLYRTKYNRMFFSVLSGWLVAVFGETIDTFAAGLILGQDAVAGIELCTANYNIQYFFASIIGIGASLLYGRDIGQNDKESARKHCGLSIIVAIFIGIFGFFFMGQIKDAYLGFFSDTSVITEYAGGYYDGLRIMQSFYALYWAIYYLVVVDGDNLLILCVDITATIVNAVLSALLAYRLGTFGIGLATAISFFVSGLLLITHLFKKSNNIGIKLYFNLKDFIQMLSLGANTAFSNLYVALISIVFNKYIINTLGEQYIAVFAIVMFALEMSNCSLSGINAAEPFISVAYGEKNPFAQRQVMKLASILTILTGILLATIFVVIAPIMPGWFGIEDPYLQELGQNTLRILSISLLISSVIHEFSEYYPSVDHFKLGNGMNIFNNLIAPIAICLPLGLKGGFNAMIWGFDISAIITVALFSIIIILKYGREKFPYLIENNPNILYHLEFAVVTNQILEVINQCANAAKEKGYSERATNNLRLILEEVLMLIIEKNKGRKVFAECTMYDEDGKLTVSIKDNGEYNNIVDDSKIISLRSYVLARMMKNTLSSDYISSVTFNRNTFTIKSE